MKGLSQFWQIIIEVIENANLVLEILDARDPIGTRNKRIEKHIQKNPDKRLVLILNKIDLVPKEIISKWQEILQSEFPVISISATRGFERTIRYLRKKISELAPSLPAYVAIVGYSNVGKSTIINGLKGHKTVGVSPQAGFTRGKQYIQLSETIRLIDSPGIIPIEGDELDLALKAGIKPEKINDIDSVVKEIIKRAGISTLTKIYNVQFTQLDELLKGIAQKRGKLLPGAVPDIYEAAKIIVRDWQRNKIPHYVLPD